MATQAQPIDLLDTQRLLPTELRTAEMAMLDQWTRERSFYMATVTRVEILQEMQEMVRQSAAGEAGEHELRKRWEQFLADADYQPLPGQEGTIKDLRSLRRFNTALRTNVALMHEWAAKENSLRPGPLRAQPAWELIRLESARVPRDWRERWARVGGEFWGDTGRMIAPKLSEVWELLGSRAEFEDALGVDYPPFAWGSGMGRVGVGAREIMDLGVMRREDIQAQIAAGSDRPVASPNESLQSTPRVTERTLRDEVAEQLGGLARWDGDTLVMTDPNGTRPMTQAQLGETWSRPLPKPFRTPDHPDGQMQRDALIEHISDGRAFEHRQGSDAWEDWQRLLQRLVNTSRPEKLHRGMQMSSDRLDRFLRTIERDGYTVRRNPDTGQWLRAGDSWTDNPRAAARFADLDEPFRRDRWSVLMELDGAEAGDSFKEIGELVQQFQSLSRKRINPPVGSESEWVFRVGGKLQPAKIRRDRERRLVTISLTTSR